jgi:hypothetical protein
VESTALGQVVTLDQTGTVQVPNQPYISISEYTSQMVRGQSWRTVEEMTASIKRSAPGVPDEKGYPRGFGLPEGSPNPNAIYMKDGQYIRYVVDTREPTERYVSGGVVRERIKFVPRMVSLTLAGARAAVAAVTETSVYKHCDFWNGFTWIRDGHIPERDFPTMAKRAAEGADGAELVFEQPVSPNDEAVIRHQIAHIERTRPTLPIEDVPVAGTVTAAQSVPFPEATSAVPDGDTPTADFVPEPPKRGPGRPPKTEG